MSQKSDKGFKALERIWYNKLKESGFDDIEDLRNPDIYSGKIFLKEWSSNLFKNKFNKIKYETTIAYYQQARGLLFTHKFQSEIQKRIWELHCDGLTVREIAKRIKIYKKSSVHIVIAEISRIIKQ